MCRSPAIFSVYLPSDHKTTSSNVTLGPQGCKFACKQALKQFVLTFLKRGFDNVVHIQILDIEFHTYFKAL